MRLAARTPPPPFLSHLGGQFGAKKATRGSEQKFKNRAVARFLRANNSRQRLLELLKNPSAQVPHLMGAKLPALLHAAHPDTVAMTDYGEG